MKKDKLIEDIIKKIKNKLNPAINENKNNLIDDFKELILEDIEIII